MRIHFKTECECDVVSEGLEVMKALILGDQVNNLILSQN